MRLSAQHPFIAVDWGTQSFRAAMISPEGEILDEFAQPRGIASFSRGQFAPYLMQVCANMTRAGAQSFVLSGMIGTKAGMGHVPYCPCPFTVQDAARGALWVVPERVAIVPGVRIDKLDVMRGQEVEVFGAAAVLGLRDALVVLPGAHSKWVNVENGTILGFNTFMTGEFYDVLAAHSTLARILAQPAAPFDAGAFLRGIETACSGYSLLITAFGMRVKSLFKEIAAEQAASYLSGLMIGEELVSMQVQPGAEIVLVGEREICERYKLALEHLGAQVTTLGNQAAWAGLYQVYQAMTKL